ncbi:MAG: site-specific DNA-methyltransferase [Clostridia bacterium]|nr:site-specific DNA-methyltransferase [Clostridia bacterium]
MKGTETLDKRIKYLTVKETAAKWGVTTRRVTQLCAGGKVRGAKQCGEEKLYWMIPNFAKRPGDGRVKTGQFSRRQGREMDMFVNELFETDLITKLKEIPAGSVDMIITDLYFLQDDREMLDALPVMWSEYRRVLKDSGVAVVLTRGIGGLKVIEGNDGWLRYKFAWLYSNCWTRAERSQKPENLHMDAWVFAKDDAAASLKERNTDCEELVKFGYGLDPAVIPDVLSFKTEDGSMFASFDAELETLGRFLIRTYTQPGDIVLDNACNHLAFIKAAVLEGRNFIGMEARAYPVYQPEDDIIEDEPFDWINYTEDFMKSLYLAWRDLPPEKKIKIKYSGEISQFMEYGDDYLEFFGEMDEEDWDMVYKQPQGVEDGNL